MADRLNNLTPSYDYIWIGIGPRSTEFNITVRSSKVEYKNSLYYHGGIDFGCAPTLSGALAIADHLVESRRLGFKYGVRVSEEASAYQADFDDVQDQLAKEAAAKQSSINQLEDAIQAYYDQVGEYPPDTYGFVSF